VSAFYNEWERYPAAWIRNLIAAGHVADGIVDERSIVELRATDLAATQCHLFAGVAGWSYALRLAGWPDDRPVWTASCPCQPFSSAGKRRGTDDERHLWPVLFELVRECRPAILFGEQVASPDGRAWFDAVSDDLESAGYAVGAANLCAAGVGAPHIRQRLYFVAVADADHAGPQGWRERRDGAAEWPTRSGGVVGGLADDSSSGRREGCVSQDTASERAGSSDDGRMGDTDRDGAGRVAGGRAGTEAAGDRARGVDGHDGHDAGAPSPWSDAEWIRCTDGKSRPAQPGSFPLAHGVPARVGKLRAYGNAIVPQVAATFIRAVMA
jgi:DNA (cytosine-5)-methyltransferase 1